MPKSPPVAGAWLHRVARGLLLWSCIGSLVPCRAVAAPEPAGSPGSEPGFEAKGSGVRSPSAPRTVTLSDCLQLVEGNFPKIREARAKLKNKQAQAWQARTQPYSEMNLQAGLVLAPTVRGTSLLSPDTDTAVSSNMALAWQLGADGVFPLWTFGKIENVAAAADAQVRLGQHEIRKEANEARLAVRRAYYGSVLARDVLGLIREAAQHIDAHLDRLKREVDSGEGDDLQLIKLRLYRSDLSSREVEAERQQTVALAGLRFLTGLQGDLRVADETLQVVTDPIRSLEEYLAMAQRHRPEVNMARAGVSARRAQLRLERAKQFPDLGLGWNARYSYAPEVVDQTNPFVRDNGNFLYYGVGLVMRYKLDILPQLARVDQAHAQLDEVLATERWARSGVGQQVREAYVEVRSAKTKLEIAAEASRLAKQWLLKVQQGIDIGTMEEEDIVDPAKEYALRRFAEMMGIFDYNVACAKLAQVTGWETTPRLP